MNCKHNWIPSDFGKAHRTPNNYLYQCTRCNRMISALLKDTNEKP